MNLKSLFLPTGMLPVLKREGAPGIPSSTLDDKAVSSTAGATYGANIVYAGNEKTALAIGSVYRAMEIIAKTEGQLQMQYQRKNNAGGNFVPNLYCEGKRINYLLQVQPNPLTTASAFFQQLAIQKRMSGNAIAYIERSIAGEPVAFWLAHGSYNVMNNTYDLTWLSDKGMKNRPNIPAADVIHIPNTYRYPDSNWGMSTLTFAFRTLSLIATQNQQALETAAKGGRMKLIIGEAQQQNGGYQAISQGFFNKKQMDAYAREIQDKLYNNDVVAMRGLDKVTNISLNAQEMQLMELLNFGVDDVARFFGVPRILLMVEANSNYKSPESATQEFLTRTIQPDIREIEDEFNRKLLTPMDFGDRRYHLCELPLLRLDRMAQAQIDKIHLETGAKCVNEIRAQYDLPTVENGDTFYVSTNLAELGSDKLRMSGAGRPTDIPLTQIDIKEGGEQ